MLKRIFGLHGSGKSNRIYEILEKCIQDKKPAFLIVPEQQGVSAERMLIDKLGNPANMYVEVINFKRLCNRVFRESGGIVDKVPDKITKQLAMSQVIYSLSDNLKEYSSLAQDAEFALKMSEVVEGMHMARISSQDIEKALPEIRENGGQALCNKLHDIALLSDGYNSYVNNKLEFSGDLLDKLYETLCSYDFFKGRTVFFDSFYGFTAQELCIIERIIETAQDTYMTFLCSDEKQEDKCFSRGTQASRLCRQFANKHGVLVEDEYLTQYNSSFESPALREIAKSFSLDSLGKADYKDKADSTGIEIRECKDIYDEAECAVKIVSNLMSEGVLPREIAICAGAPSEYSGILDDLFEKANIPFCFDTHADLSATSVSSLIRSAFDIYFSWSLESVTEYIKTGLSGLCDDKADELDIYMHTWNINSKALFHESWYMHPDGFVDKEPDALELERINSSKELLLSCLDPFCNSIDKSETVRDICTAVYTLTKDIALLTGNEVLDDRADGANLDLLFRLLDNMVDTLGQEQITPKRFYDLFCCAVKNMSTGKIPELIDQVRFSPVSLMRNDEIKYVILLGVNDSVFPAKPDKSNIFADSERKLLKQYSIDIADTDDDKIYDQLFLAYTALCCASKGAYVLYRRMSMSYDQMYKSVIVGILEAILGDITQTYLPQTLLDNAISDEILYETYMTLPNTTEKSTLRKYFEEKQDFVDRIRTAPQFEKDKKPLSKKAVDQLYGENIQSSYSRIEKYRKCPFGYFCRYTLCLKPEPKAELGAAETGNAVHKILEELIPEFISRFSKKQELSGEYIKTVVREKLVCLKQDLLHGSTGLTSKRFEYMFYRLEGALVSLCLELVKEMSYSSFIPADFELKLGRDCDVPPIKVELSGGRSLEIVGAIDRVDLYTDAQSGKTWIRITDYKTGDKTFKLEDIDEGFNLQMLLYLYALTSQETSKYGKAYPAGVVYRIVERPDATKDFRQVTAEDFEESESTVKISGLVVDDKNVLNAMDSSFGEGQKIKYIPIKTTTDKKTDQRIITSGALSLEHLVDKLKFAVAKAAELAEEISSGNKGPKPYYKNKNDHACLYCDYGDICARKIKKQ